MNIFKNMYVYIHSLRYIYNICNYMYIYNCPKVYQFYYKIYTKAKQVKNRLIKQRQLYTS